MKRNSMTSNSNSNEIVYLYHEISYSVINILLFSNACKYPI